MLLNKFFLLILLSITLFAYPQISQDIKDKKIYPMGEKIYKSRCANFDVKHYDSYEELKNEIRDEKICGSLSSKYLQALSLYLWDIKRGDVKTYEKLTVTKEQKCDFCGMYMYNYPTWISRIKYKKDKIYNFDGIKCMFKFYFQNKNGIKNILVQDYYTLKTINAKDAFFVVGSDVYGPMGYELVPFKDKKSAKSFSLEHKGTEVLTFDEITESMVRSLGH